MLIVFNVLREELSSKDSQLRLFKDSGATSAVSGAARIALLESELKQAKVASWHFHSSSGDHSDDRLPMVIDSGDHDDYGDDHGGGGDSDGGDCGIDGGDVGSWGQEVVMLVG